MMRFAALAFSAVLTIVVVETTAVVDLPMGDINVVVVTDVHSWVGGHGAHDTVLDADYGDVLSFYERLRTMAKQHDIYLVNNGDFMDGTGLSTYPPIYLEPILLKLPWDAFNVGNHDIYKSETVQFMTRRGGLVETLGERYLTSNVVHTATKQPVGHRYRYLRGKHATVLTFGFILNLEGIGSPLVTVERVQDVVRQEWFLQTLRAKDYHAILVLAHMEVDDPGVTYILQAIRKEAGPHMPVQFLNGHTHHRRHDVLDDWCTALEAGRYLDTVGFVSFPTNNTAATFSSRNATGLFRHELLDANVKTLQSRLGVPKLKTENGQALTDFIHKTQDDMGLRQVIGCSPQTYYLNRSLVDEDSLFGLWANAVIPTLFLRDTNRLVLQGKSSSFRYDLFEGEVTLDDLMIMSPFNDSLYLIASNVPSSQIMALNSTMNQKQNMDLPGLPDFILIGPVERQQYDLYTLEYEVPFLQRALEEISGRQVVPKPVNVYATSLWLSFIKTHWPTCRVKRKETYGEKQSLSLSPSAFPDNLSLVVAAVCGASSLVLLGAFLLRRIPPSRTRDTERVLVRR